MARWRWAMRSWFATSLYIFRYVPKMAGFRQNWEFLICAVPTLVVGFYGVFAQEVLLGIYAGAWFFGG
jgi:hypothetical protein